jgi:hypothetical protein
MVDGIGGLNGTFFDARNNIVGPALSGSGKRYAPSHLYVNLKCSGRPIVLLGTKSLRIMPFEPDMGTSIKVLRSLVPDVQDAFVGGGWLVRNGKVSDVPTIRHTFVSTAMDFRPRAAVGVDAAGRMLLFATREEVSSFRFAEAMAKVGAVQGVLLDSGLSTCLMWKGRAAAAVSTGNPPRIRPVPHAFIVFSK